MLTNLSKIATLTVLHEHHRAEVVALPIDVK